MAEKEGFEPPVPFQVQLISSQSHSATLPLLQYYRETGYFLLWQVCTEKNVSFDKNKGKIHLISTTTRVYLWFIKGAVAKW